MEDTKYVFEAKAIQRMELLVLSTLEWKMHPVTPLSFLDNIIRRLGLKTHLHWEFLMRCERLLLSVVSGKQPQLVLKYHLTKSLVLSIKTKNKENYLSFDFLSIGLRFVKYCRFKIHRLCSFCIGHCYYDARY